MHTCFRLGLNAVGDRSVWWCPIPVLFKRNCALQPVFPNGLRVTRMSSTTGLATPVKMA